MSDPISEGTEAQQRPTQTRSSRRTWTEQQHHGLAHYCQGHLTVRQLGGAAKILGQLQHDHPRIFDGVTSGQIAEYLKARRKQHNKVARRQVAAGPAATQPELMAQGQQEAALEDPGSVAVQQSQPLITDPPDIVDEHSWQPDPEESSSEEDEYDDIQDLKARQRQNFKFYRQKTALMKSGLKFAQKAPSRTEVVIVVIGPGQAPQVSTMGRGLAFNNSQNVEKVASLARKLMEKARSAADNGGLGTSQPQHQAHCNGVRRRRDGRPFSGRSGQTAFQVFLGKESGCIRSRLQQSGLPTSQQFLWRIAAKLWEQLPEVFRLDSAAAPSLTAVLDNNADIWEMGKGQAHLKQNLSSNIIQIQQIQVYVVPGHSRP